MTDVINAPQASPAAAQRDRPRHGRVELMLSAALLLASSAIVVTPLHAANCPTDIETAGKVRLLDDTGNTTFIEATSGGFVRRTIEVATPAKGTTPASTYKSIVDAYQGLFAESITSINGTVTSVQYFKITGDDYARLRQFLPPKPGTSLVLDYENILISGTGGFAPPAAVPPARRMHAELRVTGEQDVTVGTCTYPTKIIEMTQTNGDGSFKVTATYNYAPQIKGWLKVHSVNKMADKPENDFDRAMVSITVETTPQ